MASGLKVLFEDNHLLVVDKPALLATMGVREGDDSLVVRARDYLREKYNKPGNVYIGVVSRIDSFVSGVIVFARTSKSASRLSDQFRSRTVKKTYLALIPADDSFPEAGRLVHRLVKNEAQHRMVALPANAKTVPGEKSAILTYETLGCHSNLRLIRIELETGRKHQIRIQFAASGVPIVGDRKYDSPLGFKTGIALHAYELTFEHPTKKSEQSFKSIPPMFWNLARFGYSA